MRDGAQSMQITQFGLSAFAWEDASAAAPRGQYVAKTFNFYIFPRPFEDRRDRRFMSQVGGLRGFQIYFYRLCTAPQAVWRLLT